LITLVGLVGIALIETSVFNQSIFLTLVLFGIIGLLDDINRMNILPGKPLGLSFETKLIIQLSFSTVVGLFIATHIESLEILPGHTVSQPALIALTISLSITFMANAFNITDGVDGLAIGLFLIVLSASLAIPGVPVAMGNALSVLIGCSLAFFYFNTSPARVFMGDTGALGLGACLPLIFIFTNTFSLMPLFCLVFLAEAFSSLLQLGSKKLIGKKLFSIAPFHHWLEYKGWSESKIAMRLWLFGILVAILSLGIVQVIF
jgi:phospho-N-acetylmuramoyl-pentapeptide-transferase